MEEDFFGRIPYDWDVVQITSSVQVISSIRIHKRFVNEFSTACYIITRHHEKMIRLHCRKDKYKLDNGVRPVQWPDDLLYNSGNTYVLPFFSITFLSVLLSILTMSMFSTKETTMLIKLLVPTRKQLSIDHLMNYDPYFGRVSEPTGNNLTKKE